MISETRGSFLRLKGRPFAGMGQKRMVPSSAGVRKPTDRKVPFDSGQILDGNRIRLFSCVLFPFILFLLSGCLRETNSHSAGESDTQVERSGEVSVSQEIQNADPRPEFSGRDFQQAPMLERRVQAGELPPVNERLPETPLVITPVEKPGRYGGAIRRALIADIVDQYVITKTLNENLVGFERFPPNRIQLNLAERYTFEDDGKAAIFKLRKGIRWSDGEPFTVDDILFWYEDFALDENARNMPLFPSWWHNAGEPVKLEKLGPYTLKISSHRPLGSILHTLSYDELALPKHWFSRYHPRYNTKATYSELRKRTTLARLAYEPGTPRLSAWVPIEWIRGQRALFERNPYYWKIDTAGNQLPYADRLEFTVIPNPEVILTKFINGELDLFGHYFSSRMYESLKHEAKRGQFRVLLSEPIPAVGIYLNWDAPDVALREAFRNLKVRMALSHGINRREISELVFHGLLSSTGIALSRSSSFYSQKAALLYSQYDPEQARSLLDAAGYRDRDGDGIRELGSGSPLEFTLDVFAKSDGEDIGALLTEYWKEIGIKVHLNIALQEIIVPRRVNGEFEMTFYRAATDPVISSEFIAIMGPSEPFWHRNANREGPAWLREMTVLIKQMQTTVDPDKRRLLTVKIRELYVENLPMLTLGEGRRVWGAQNRLGNVPPTITNELFTRDWDRAVFHEQIYIKE
jgi:peptide/nickel transport system substrate-binding protein